MLVPAATVGGGPDTKEMFAAQVGETVTFVLDVEVGVKLDERKFVPCQANVDHVTVLGTLVVGAVALKVIVTDSPGARGEEEFAALR